MKLLKKLLDYVLSPITLGIVIAAVAAYIAMVDFYDIEGRYHKDEERLRILNPIYMALKSLHDKSIDYRFRARGPRKGSSQVAVLAVDDESIEEIGRWPWPRSKISQVIKKAVDYGAAVIGFDIVFSENEENTTQSVLYRLREQAAQKDPELLKQIDREILNSDSDKVLVETVANLKKQLVMGSFAPNLPLDLEEKRDQVLYHSLAPGESAIFREICEDTFLKNSYHIGMWNNSSSYSGSEDPYMESIPGPIREPLVEKLYATLHQINQKVIRQWLNQYKGNLQDHLPDIIKSVPPEHQVSLLEYFFNEDLISIEERGSELLAREISPEESNSELNRFRLLIPNADRIRLLSHMQEEQLLYCAGWLSNEDPHLESYQEIWQKAQTEHPDKMPKISFADFVWHLKSPAYFRRNIVFNTYDWTLNIPAISNTSENMGYFDALLDFDGSIRRSKLYTRYGTTSYMPSIGLRTYTTHLKVDARPLIGEIQGDPANPYSIGITGVELAERAEGEAEPKTKILKTSSRGEIFINYAGKQKMFPHVSAKELISDAESMVITENLLSENGNWEPKAITVNKHDFMKDKILIFGVTAIAVFDLRLSPFEENYPGVETHANVVDNLLRNDYLLTDVREKTYMPWILLAMGVALSFALGLMPATWSLIITIGSIIAVYYVDKYFFFTKGTITAVIFPLALIFVTYVVLTFYRYVTEERKKKELRTTFAKYVSPQIVNEVLADPDNLQLGGRKEHMTVFFSDVRGFTTISEKLDPEALSDLLNEYLTPMTELVFSNRGTLDKYMGDAVMAFFGAPISTPTHAQDACRCALQSIAKMFELQKQFAAKGLPVIDIGIGLNTGEMSVGNMGSTIVRNYTVMGDAVNLGSRLEGINKEYGTRIIISEFTQKEIGDSFVTREIDWVRVKGKVLPVRIFELMAEKSVPEATQQMLGHFNKGFKLYHEQAWSEALKEFQAALKAKPEDPVSELYVERCQGYLEDPPDAGWDGVFVMKTK